LNKECALLPNLTLEMPDDLVRRLEGIAAAQRKSVQQLALDQLQSLVEAASEYRPGSPTAVLRAVQELPHLSPAEVDDLDAAIESARLPVQVRDPFSPTSS
jgi:hypothetical protein